MKNRDVFLIDPMTRTIPNDGVTKVFVPDSPQAWEVLRYELSNFVCEGQYRAGLERILNSYLTSLDKAEQPAVWVNGFYGSGKSHLVRVLEYLWRDVTFPDGASARGLVNLPSEIVAHFKELSTAGKRAGGLWSAAGTLSAGTGSVRLMLLGVLFACAGLPTSYATARFVIWLRQNAYYESVKAGVEKSGKDFAKELNNLYVSPYIANNLLEVYPDFADSSAEARSLLKAQYPKPDDISAEELLTTVEDVLSLQSTTPGKLPCTLLIFDELQQFIGDDSDRALQVQTAVEACSSRFGSRLLFVATGQQALQGTPQLSKLQGRFTVDVSLSDTDVEHVVRQVVLRKAENKKQDVKEVLDKTSGEIDRQLAGTKIGRRPSDTGELVPDYPLLPVRRRFWERVLRAIDSAGTAGQLRTQLRIVHEAARHVADQPLGTVVAGDFIYGQLRSAMLQSGALLRDLEVAISNLGQAGDDGNLCSRLCATIFLINKLPTERGAATGIRATSDTLADLLVEDLTAGSAGLRQRIPGLLDSLVESGMVIKVDDEYRLQTRESAEWEADFKSRYAHIIGDDSRIASDRATELRKAIHEALRGLTFTQGVTKTPRKFVLHLGPDMPSTETGAVPIWIRDEWSVPERTVREDAQLAGIESPVVFVFIPRQSSDALKGALAGRAAAKESLEARPLPSTPEGLEARGAMQTRLQTEQGKVKTKMSMLVGGARVFQGGGVEVTESDFHDAIRSAVEAGLVRLFPEFSTVDVLGWETVRKRAGDGATDALAAVGYKGDVDKHPACRKIREFIGGAGKRGGDIRKQFMGAQYGWPQDAVDGCLLALMAAGLVRASKNGQALSVKGISQSQIGVIDFYSEGVTVTVLQRVEVRKLLTEIGVSCKAGEESAKIVDALQRLDELAQAAGGRPPLPMSPKKEILAELSGLTGNEQFMVVHEHRDALLKAFKQWSQATILIEQRLPRWSELERLLTHAHALPVRQEVELQRAAILSERSLLTEPDPVVPLVSQMAGALRVALQAARKRLAYDYERDLAALEASSEWQQLPPGERADILEANKLRPVAELRVGTDSELLAELDKHPLADWDNRIAALPGRFTKARQEASKRLLPKSVYVTAPPATLKSPAEVDSYLEDLRREIMAHIDQGKPVIL